MSQSCSQCAALRAQITGLEHANAFLRGLLAALVGGVRGTVEFMQAEQAEPSMPRGRLSSVVEQRLTYLVERAEGRRY
jgi:hypothetical protein